MACCPAFALSLPAIPHPAPRGATWGRHQCPITKQSFAVHRHTLGFFHTALLLNSFQTEGSGPKSNAAITCSSLQKTKLRWQWARLDDLQPCEQYEMHRLRQEVFVVEQECVYLDADGSDLDAFHLLGWTQRGTGLTFNCLSAYLRAMEDADRKTVKLGRIVTAPAYRGQGLGRELMKTVLKLLDEEFANYDVRLDAQTYATGFYEKFGFETYGEEFDEDGIPHVGMERTIARSSPHPPLTPELEEQHSQP